MAIAGPNLRTERKAAGLSQQRLAELAGCSLSMVRLVEAGYQPEPSDVLDRITLALSKTEARPDTGLREDTARQGRDASG